MKIQYNYTDLTFNSQIVVARKSLELQFCSSIKETIFNLKSCKNGLRNEFLCAQNINIIRLDIFHKYLISSETKFQKFSFRNY